MSIGFRRGGFLVIALLALPHARAATLQYTTSIPTQSYLNLAGSTSQTVPAHALAITVPVTLYDPAAHGPLTSVTIDFETGFELDFDNGTAGGGNSFEVGGSVELGGHGYDSTGNGAGDGGAPGSHFALTAPISLSTTLSDPNNPAEQALIGTGHTNFKWDEADDVVVNSFAGGDAQFFRNDGGSLTVTYNFVPEPGLAGVIGLAGLMQLRRRHDRVR